MGRGGRVEANCATHGMKEKEGIFSPPFRFPERGRLKKEEDDGPLRVMAERA